MMSSKLLISIFIGCFIVQLSVENTSAACVCKEKGTDYCAACNERVVVRPKPKYYDTTPDLTLPPIGDNCWCSKLMIEPAALPKTCSKVKPPPPSCACKEPAPPVYALPHPVNYVAVDKPKDLSPPADPISVSLAIKAGKAIEVPEAKLAYGFVQKPLDGLKRVHFSNVPEENLYKLKSEVITLKHRSRKAPTPEEEELVEVEDEEEALADEEQPHFTYKQLGYVPEQFKNPKFRQVHPAYIIDEEYDAKPVYGKVTVDCGFRPGRISAYEKPDIKSYANDCY